MSITRKLLKGMGLTDEQQETILEAHTETLTEIKEERDKYKQEAAALEDVQKQLDELKAKGEDGYREKYEKEHKAFEDYKKDISAQETRRGKENAYRAILEEIGIPAKRIDKILKLCDVDGVELEEDGGIKGAEKLKESLKSEWSDFVETTSLQGTQTATPPANTGGNVGSKSKDEIINMKDATARQKAIAENMQEFGIKQD